MLMKAIPSQIPEDVRSFLSPGRFVQLGKDWHALAEDEREYSLGSIDRFGPIDGITPADSIKDSTHQKSILPISVEYMKKYLNIFFRLANDCCGHPPLKGWDEVMQNLDTDPDVAINYLASEIRKAVIRCCLVEKTEAEAFLIHNNYTLYTETTTEASESAKKAEAAEQKNVGDPLTLSPPINVQLRISNNGTGQRQMENTRNENPELAHWFDPDVKNNRNKNVQTAKQLMMLNVPRSILACFVCQDSINADAADQKLKRLLEKTKQQPVPLDHS